MILARYEINKKVDSIMRFIIWRLPRRFVMWSFIRVVAYATTGKYSNTVVPEITAMEALERWPSK